MPYIQSIAELNEIIKKWGAIIYNMLNKFIPLYLLTLIHHKKDDWSDAHLFIGLLAYWIVNTIRYKLKQTGETCYWTEIVRRLSTQKAGTTEALNALGEKVQMRLWANRISLQVIFMNDWSIRKCHSEKSKSRKVCSTQSHKWKA